MFCGSPLETNCQLLAKISYVGDIYMTPEVCQDAGSATDAMTTAALTTIRRQKVFSQSSPEGLKC